MSRFEFLHDLARRSSENMYGLVGVRLKDEAFDEVVAEAGIGVVRKPMGRIMRINLEFGLVVEREQGA